MLLKEKNAIIYGAGGAIGSTLARTFAREGATVFLTGRKAEPLQAVAEQIRAAGGSAEIDLVDASDADAVDTHFASVLTRAGKVDISINAIGIEMTGVQGIPLTSLSAELLLFPITTYVQSNFLTARAAGRHMAASKGGVILTLTGPPAKTAMALSGGMPPAWASLETLVRSFAVELGSFGVRAVGLRIAPMPETDTVQEIVGLHAQGAGLPPEQLATMLIGATLLKRLPVLTEAANTAAFLASDYASAITGTTVNVSCGLIVD